MELNLEEQTLIAAYRRLGETAKRELLSFAMVLQEKARVAAAADSESVTGSCKIARKEERPETTAEPICTE